MLSGYFFDPSKGVAVATNVVGKIDYQSTRMTFVPQHLWPPAYDKKGNCYAGRRQTNYLSQWTQANQLTDQLTIISI